LVWKGKNEMKALQIGIVAETVGSNLATNVGSRIYFMEPPQNISYPYVTFYFPTEFTNDYFNAKPNMEEVSVTFDIFSDGAKSSVECGNLYEDLKAAFDSCALTVTGFTHISMERTGAILLRDPINSLWQYSVDYDVVLVKT